MNRRIFVFEIKTGERRGEKFSVCAYTNDDDDDYEDHDDDDDDDDDDDVINNFYYNLQNRTREQHYISTHSSCTAYRGCKKGGPYSSDCMF